MRTVIAWRCRGGGRRRRRGDRTKMVGGRHGGNKARRVGYWRAYIGPEKRSWRSDRARSRSVESESIENGSQISTGDPVHNRAAQI